MAGAPIAATLIGTHYDALSGHHSPLPMPMMPPPMHGLFQYCRLRQWHVASKSDLLQVGLVMASRRASGCCWTWASASPMHGLAASQPHPLPCCTPSWRYTIYDFGRGAFAWLPVNKAGARSSEGMVGRRADTMVIMVFRRHTRLSPPVSDGARHIGHSPGTTGWPMATASFTVTGARPESDWLEGRRYRRYDA